MTISTRISTSCSIFNIEARVSGVRTAIIGRAHIFYARRRFEDKLAYVTSGKISAFGVWSGEEKRAGKVGVSFLPH